MKIKEIKTLSGDRYNYVKITTDENIVGYGEIHPASGTSGTPFVSMAGVKYCEEYLINKNPLEIEKHWQHMFRRQIFRGGSDMMAAMGAIDIALWDIKGKAYNKPVYELLGGKVRDKVRLYTHLQGVSKEELSEDAEKKIEEGFTAVRLYPFGSFGSKSFAEGSGLEQMSFTSMQRHAYERVEAVRKAVGPDVDIMIDVVNRLTPPEAVAIGNALRDLNLYFFEDPIEPENMEQWKLVASQQPIPIAMGERLYTLYQFKDLLVNQGASYIRPDLSLAGGITNVKKISNMAEAFYAGVVPHNPLSSILTASCIQIDASVHNIPVQEYPYDDNLGTKKDLVDEPIKRVGGYLEIPNKPGIGVNLNEEAFKHYPPKHYDRDPLIFYDGGLKDY